MNSEIPETTTGTCISGDYKQKVLVTGANGYIGAHVVAELLKRDDCQVIAVDFRNDYIDPRATFINRNILAEGSDPSLFRDLGSPDKIIHMAWRNGFVHNAPTHLEDLPLHFRFLSSMMEAGCKSISVMGTMHEVGYHEGAICEDTPCRPLSFYGVSKNALRQAMQLAAGSNGVSLKWLRAYYILGDDIRSASIFSKILKMEEEGKQSFPFTTGVNKYDFITVDDLAMQIVCASCQDKVDGVINVCSGEPVALKDKVEEFIREKGLAIRPEYGVFPSRKYDSPAVWGDASKIKQILKGC